MGLVLIKERRILFSEFALSKSQYLYNKGTYYMASSESGQYAANFVLAMGSNCTCSAVLNS